MTEREEGLLYLRVPLRDVPYHLSIHTAGPASLGCGTLPTEACPNFQTLLNLADGFLNAAWEDGEQQLSIVGFCSI